jgi:hypothetical protein
LSCQNNFTAANNKNPQKFALFVSLISAVAGIIVVIIQPSYITDMKNLFFPPLPEHSDPIARISGPNEVYETDGITLRADASESHNDNLTYKWHYNGGIDMGSIGNDDEPLIYLTAPDVDVDSQSSFLLRVTDDVGKKATDTHNVTVQDKERPIVSIKEIPFINENTLVRLDGSDSRDNNNRALSYNWTVVRGPLNLTLDNPTSLRPILNVPSIEEDVYAIIKLKINNGVSTAEEAVPILIKNTPSTHTTSDIPTRPEIRFVADTNLLLLKQIFPLTVQDTNVKSDMVDDGVSYSNKTNGQTWDLNTLFANNSQARLADGTITKNSDNSLKIKPADESGAVRQGGVTLYVDTPDYATAQERISESNHKVFEENGYMFNEKDWKNVEITAFLKINEVNNERGSFSIDARGERHLGDHPCTGTSYKTELSVDGDFAVRKEQWHPFLTSANTTNIGSIANEWIGITTQIYNIESKSGPVVKIENYYTKESLGNVWIQLDEFVDKGEWGTGGEKCEGRPDQIITWGGPIISFNFDDIDDVDIKDFSIREIQPPQ